MASKPDYSRQTAEDAMRDCFARKSWIGGARAEALAEGCAVVRVSISRDPFVVLVEGWKAALDHEMLPPPDFAVAA